MATAKAKAKAKPMKKLVTIDERLAATEKLLAQPLPPALEPVTKIDYRGPHEVTVCQLLMAATRIARGAIKDGARMAAGAVEKHTGMQSFRLGGGVNVVFDVPEGAIDPQFIPEAVKDLEATYQRCLERSWAKFEAATGYTRRAKTRAA
jgi:hypothetical protein